MSDTSVTIEMQRPLQPCACKVVSKNHCYEKGKGKLELVEAEVRRVRRFD